MVHDEFSDEIGLFDIAQSQLIDIQSNKDALTSLLLSDWELHISTNTTHNYDSLHENIHLLHLSYFSKGYGIDYVLYDCWLFLLYLYHQQNSDHEFRVSIHV